MIKNKICPNKIVDSSPELSISPLSTPVKSRIDSTLGRNTKHWDGLGRTLGRKNTAKRSLPLLEQQVLTPVLIKSQYPYINITLILSYYLLITLVFYLLYSMQKLKRVTNAANWRMAWIKT